ncbi:hypothetical protein H2514_03130 [Lysobacter sp. CW239]|uniref:hypothetical protein n=1 Tax=Lysobacteraceae TaxID=32033 RepID=UPI000689C089|nr:MULTISPECIES: hypothetical protein [Lysobacter]QOD91658.1 hypothetical protein H2514_03130 [Lysobacter sp. CW239]
MPCEYKAKSGQVVEFDLDRVVDVALGFSLARPTWTATLIYVSATDAFVELRSSPQDYRGNSAEESEEVDLVYMSAAFGLNSEQAALVKSDQASWRTIDLRGRA